MKPSKCLCYYPTNVAIIDDSKSFLAMVNKELDPKQPRRLYADPITALREINAAEQSGEQLKHILKNLSGDTLDELKPDYETNALVHVDLKNLYNEVYNAQRFDRISVVLVDYKMAEMNGVEFFRNLKDKAITRIMITAISDYKLAVQAFNEGLIDKFILKDTPNLFREINKSIAKAEKDYFKHIYGIDGIIGFIFRGQLQFGTREYYHLIEQISNTINPVEYYLLDKSGSVLFLNEQAEPTWLIVRTAKELEELTAIAKDHQAPANILAALRNAQEMPILLCEDDYRLTIKDWRMYPIKALSPQVGYYALIINQKFSALDQDKITSFKKYHTKRNLKF